MSEEPALGVVFPVEGEGRSTSATGRAVIADALEVVDPVGARAVRDEANWRTGYPLHFRRLVEAGLGTAADAVGIADGGLTSVHSRMRWSRPEGTEVALGEAFSGDLRPMGTERLAGSGEPEAAFSLPYRGDRLSGVAAAAQIHDWVARGIIEPSCGDAVELVIAHPEWLDLSDFTFVVLGAAAEMGPLRALLRWGADVVAVDLARPDLWRGLVADTRRFAGTLRIPVAAGSAPVEERAGVDLVTEWPSLSAWLIEQPGTLVLGNYVYADGADNVRVSVAVDALSMSLRSQRPDAALAFLATPTDVFAVPAADVERATAAYANAGVSKALRGPLRGLSGGRLLSRNYSPQASPGIADAIVPQQGPNYLLAKRIQRWRATTARAEGVTVSMTVAPPTRTRSVVKNRALAAAYAGAHRFGIEVFDPATANTLMAAVLVHDLRTGTATLGHPWLDEAHQAAHGGLWTTAYSARSALGLAAVLGLGSRS